MQNLIIMLSGNVIDELINSSMTFKMFVIMAWIVAIIVTIVFYKHVKRTEIKFKKPTTAIAGQIDVKKQAETFSRFNVSKSTLDILKKTNNVKSRLAMTEQEKAIAEAEAAALKSFEGLSNK